MFTDIKKLVRSNFDKMQKAGDILMVDYNRDDIWNAYLSQFSEATRQEHNCNCCKAFIRQVGGAVQIKDLKLVSIWDIPEELIPEEYRASIKGLSDYVHQCGIKGLLHISDKDPGKDKNFSDKHQVIFEHFFVPTKAELYADNRATKSGEIRESAGVFTRALTEIKKEAVDTVKELIAQGSLYRGNDYKHLVEGLQKDTKAYEALTPYQKPFFVWDKAVNRPASELRVKNTAIGTLLMDLSEGKDLEDAVKAFERMVAPANYKRPTALATPKMIEQAKEKLSELGLLSALQRRKLDTRDLGPHNALFVHRGTEATKDVFATLAAEAPVKVQTFAKCEEVTIEKFQNDILPTCKNIRLLVENRHLNNFATLTGAVDPDAKDLFSHNNSFGWSYTGGVADSIKERVKAAGGKVDGWMRISLSWYNYDDLDLHLYGLGEKVYYGDKRSARLAATLDVDMNAGGGQTRTPVENIDIKKSLPNGEYEIRVNQFNARDPKDKGYELEVEVAGETYSFDSSKSPASYDAIRFTMLQGKPIFAKEGEAKAARSVIKWGIPTSMWRTVKAITLSPNHWNEPKGNKHWFFMLEGCVTDEATRPFYNEFLCQELQDNRKVMEMLAGKITVADAEGMELSGLGFSETIRNHCYLEIEGTFKRVIKVTF